MAGGVGSRFWPLSTKECPKQFLDITLCGRTMIQQTFDRFSGIIDIDHVWVVTGDSFKSLVQEQLSGISPEHILLEPCMRNTAPCIAYVSWKIQKEDPSAVVVVAPSDHLILNTDAFREAIGKGLDFVGATHSILTLGITPNRPETGYGYIELGGEESAGVYALRSFREKPDLPTAVSYLRQGGFVWNSGMFLWEVGTIVSELRHHAPGIASVMDSIAPALFTPSEQQSVNELFPLCEKISIDYAVMEKTSGAYVLPAEFGWSDLGTWGSLRDLSARDSSGNAVLGDGVSMIDSEGCMVHVPDGKRVIVQGLKDYVVAESNGTLLICSLRREQDIKDWHE